MGYVIKRSGKKQAFNGNKIRKAIQKGGREAGLSASRVKELIKEVAEPVIKLYKNKRVKSSVLRKAILSRLSRRSKSVVAAFRRYERKKKK